MYSIFNARRRLNQRTIWKRIEKTNYSPNSLIYSSKFSDLSFSYFLPAQTAAIIYDFFLVFFHDLKIKNKLVLLRLDFG